MTIYADSSFVVALYVSEAYSPQAEQRVAGKPQLWLTPLHVAEWIHAVELRVFRGQVSRDEAKRLHAKFEEHRGDGVWTEVDVPAMAFSVCAELARQHAAHLGVRTLDSLHVASALELKAEVFWTFDERQKNLAQAVGLRTS